MRSIEIRPLKIPFRRSFSHSSATRSTTASVIVVATSARGERGFGEACPRPYVTGEDVNTVVRFFHRHRKEWLTRLTDLETLKDWMARHKAEIDANPAAWCAVELAALDLFAKQQGCPLEAFLELPPPRDEFQYSAVLGTGNGYRRDLERYLARGFRDFKVKLSGDFDDDSRRLARLSRCPHQVTVRADANNLWQSAKIAAEYLEALGAPLMAVEEPLQSHQYSAQHRLAKQTGIPHICDESLLRVDQLDQMRGDPRLWIPNVRLSKMGGLIRSLDFIQATIGRGARVVVGAHVGESSLLTRAALPAAAMAGCSLFAHEGAFGRYLLQQDPFSPEVVFGDRGLLDAGALSIATSPGLGVAHSPSTANTELTLHIEHPRKRNGGSV